MPQPAQLQRVTPVPMLASAEVETMIAGVAGVDARSLATRAGALASGAVDREAERAALTLAIRCMDLTALEDSETQDEIVAMCARAVRPSPRDPLVPSVAAVCLYPRWASVALEQLQGTGVTVACVAGGFPRGLGPLDERLSEIRGAAAAGAGEIDVVLNRRLFLAGGCAEAYEELVAAREAAGAAQLKVIMETGELGSYDHVRQACMLAMAAGADFIKTSTGKVGVGATPESALCMMEAARDFHSFAGRRVGIKVAGGVREAAQAIRYLTLAREALGPAWLTPARFRIGASSLLQDVMAWLEGDRR